MKEEALREIRRFDADLPLERASTPPASWYTRRSIFEAERDAVFSRTWQAVGRLDQIREPGDFLAGSLAGEPWVVVRDASGELRAFYNVCRHHATRLVAGAGRCDELVCPYHGWTYGLDGRLLRARGAGGIEGFDRERFGLTRIHVRSWGPLILVCLAPTPPPLEEWLAPAAAPLDATGWTELQFVLQRTYVIECNWKVVVDNYLDGGYHVPHLHPGLASGLNLDSYRTDVLDRAVLQTVSATGDDRIGEGAVYAWIYPGLMINRYGPVLDVNRVVPVAPERTEVVFDWWFAETEGAEARAFIERSIEASDRVQQEDGAVCRGVQSGLRSASYDRGRYAPRFEAAAHRFHRLLARDLLAAENGA